MRPEVEDGAQAFPPAGSDDFPVARFGDTGLESPVNLQAGKPALRFPTAVPARRVGRAVVAAERARRARAMLADCHFCAHHCGANRLAGETGPCRARAGTRCFSAQTEVSDEIELIPTFAVALSGCDMRCDFCITGASSWNPRAGGGFSAADLAAKASAALRNGARTIMVLGGEPTVHLHSVLEFVAHLPDSVPLVWKTNAHGSVQARTLLEGIFDVWLADFKFGNDTCALRLARTPDYGRVVRENLLWAYQHSDLIVRHLLMPGHWECCWRPVAEWLGENLPGVRVSLRTGFWPAWRAYRHGELCGKAAQTAGSGGAAIFKSEAHCQAGRPAGLETCDTGERAFELARRLGLNLIP
jgi:putative pyruvate formate lyase activating enzyme